MQQSPTTVNATGGANSAANAGNVGVSAVDAPVNASLWLTISEIARQRGVDKAAVSRRVSRLEAEGRVATRPGPRGSKLVNIAGYDYAVGQDQTAQQQSADTMRTLGGLPPAPRFVGPAGENEPSPIVPPDAPVNTLTEANARKALYAAEHAALDLAEKRKFALPIPGPHGIGHASERIAGDLVRALDQIPNHADEITAAAGGTNIFAARRKLNDIVRQVKLLVVEKVGGLVEAAGAREAQGLIDVDLPIMEGETRITP